MRVLYFECFSGAAGDMILASLLDAGASESHVRDSLEALDMSGWGLDITKTEKGSLAATQVDVRVEHDQQPRSHADIVSLLDGAELRDTVRMAAKNAFDILADAEATVHGVEREAVHFHEVGAVDAIVDIVASCAAIDSLDPEWIGASSIATGRGTTVTEHGSLPVPAPATLEILKDTGATVVEKGERELLTPTGAALLAAHVDEFSPAPPMEIAAVGYGAGTADLEWPNVVRALVGETAAMQEPNASAVLIEANIDDMNPELFPSVVARLIDAGATDAWLTPIVMKKGRPAHKLSALADPTTQVEVEHVFFRETTTFGLRRTAVEKVPLAREWAKVTVEGLPVRIKVARDGGGQITTVAPEYEDALHVAQQTGLPLKEVYARALREAPED